MRKTGEKLAEYRTLETVGILAFFCLLFGTVLKVNALSYAALALLFVALFVKPAARLIATVWLKFGAVLGAVNTRAILTVIFFLVLTPIAFLHRRIHGDTLNLKDDGPANGSLWKKRDHLYNPKDLEKQW